MFIAFFVALFAEPAAAAAPPPPAVRTAPADPAAVTEAMLLLEQDGFEEEAIRSTDQTLELTLAAMVDQIQKQAGEEVPADFFEQLRKVMRDHAAATLRANMPSIKKQAAEIYAQEFTREELARLRELSRDPVMVKARERSRVMGPKLMALGAYTMKKSEPELEAKINRLVAEYLARHNSSADHS